MISLLTMLLTAAPDAGTAPECSKDSQCLLLMHAPDDCCGCGPATPMALPRKEVSRREVRCAAMGACACPGKYDPIAPGSVEPQPELRAACRAGRCVTVPATPAPPKKVGR